MDFQEYLKQHWPEYDDYGACNRGRTPAEVERLNALKRDFLINVCKVDPTVTINVHVSGQARNAVRRALKAAGWYEKGCGSGWFEGYQDIGLHPPLDFLDEVVLPIAVELPFNPQSEDKQ
ncbi:MAG TPA: hypothetical protein PLZ61_07100 [Candidatus Cryosericum sp.]|nr:hypothetical protein [Candidatus Cryosericum sp.]